MKRKVVAVVRPSVPSGSGIGAPTQKWLSLLGLASLFSLLAIVGVFAASSASADEAAERGMPLAPQLIREAVNSPRSETFGAASTDPQAAAQLPHEELDRGEALELLSSVFPTETESPGSIYDELEVEHYISNHAAVVTGESLSTFGGAEEQPPSSTAEPVLVESSLPLRTEDSEGREAPVDLGLERSEGELQAANPLVETGIPLELGEGISLANEDIKLEFPQASEESAPSTVEGEAAFYPNVETDTDLMVMPTSEGVETLEQLRSAESPRTEQIHVNLPNGAILNESSEGGAEATLNGRVLLTVPPPTAVDADGTSVPVSLAVSGEDVKVTAAPTSSNAYPILVDPFWQFEMWNWTWENSSLSTWEGASTGPSYQSLPYTYWDPNHFKGLDMTSGFPGSAPQYSAANWVFHVPRFNSDWAEYHERPKSFITYAVLGGIEFLTEGNHAVSPEMVAGIIDESSGTWVSFAYHSGYDGDVTGWSGQLALPNEHSDVNAKYAIVGLTATEYEAQAKYRNAFVATGWVGFSDHNAPFFNSLTEPTEWMNNVETSHIGYQVTDEGLGVYQMQLFRPGESTPMAGWVLGCTALPSAPCKRTYSSTQPGAVNLAFNPATAPQGIDHFKVLVSDPLGVPSSPNLRESAGEAEPTGHTATEEVPVKIDHTAPTLSLSGSITEQAALGTARPEYTLKYAAADGSEEMPPFQAAFGATGTGSGQLSHPADVAVDPNGNVWVADENNNRIEKFGWKGEYLASYGSLGSGNGQFNHPAGIEADAAGNVWVADTGNNRIEKLNEKGEFLSAFGSFGSTNGKLSSPQGIAVDSAGHIWVADTGNNRIEEFNAKGAFLASFGTKGSGVGQLSEPAALDIAPGGNVWVADTANNRIEVFNEQGDYLAAYGSLGTGNGQFNRPAAIDVDTKGNVWVADLSNGRVEQFSERGEYLGKFGAKGTGSGQFTFNGPIGLTTNRSGRLWVTDSADNRIENWNAPQGNQSGVRSVAIKVDGKLIEQPKLSCETGGCPLVGEWALHSGEYAAGTHTVEVLATDGVGLTTSKPLTITLNPPAPALILSGTMTEQETRGKTLPRYNLKLSAAAEEGSGPPTSAPTYVSPFGSSGTGNGQFSHPGDIAVDTAGNLWVVDESNNRIEKFNPAGEYLTKFGSTGTGNGQFSRPTALAIDAKGDIWVTDSGNKRVEEFNEKGEYLAKFGTAGIGNGQFSTAGPEGIAIDSKGNAWVSDTSASRLEEFNSKGEFLKVVGVKGGEPGQLSEPTGIDISPANNVFVADWANDRVEVYNEAGEYLRQFGSLGSGAGQFKNPAGIAIDPSGIVWVGDQNNERVEEFNQNGHFIAQFGSSGSGAGQFNLGYPIGITADTKGNLWVTDTANNRVQHWREPSRSLVKTEVTVDGKNVDSGEVACTTETCSTSREWILEASAYSAGKHTVIAKATDGFGKTTSKTMTIEVQRDATKPALTVGGELANAPSGWVQQESYGFNASATDPGGYGATSLVFKIDGATVASTSKPCLEGGCELSLSKAVSVAAYTGGSHQAEVVATDGAGNVSTKKWTINVDPEGHVSTAEATATLEAAEGTAPINVVGESEEEEEIEGTAPGLGIEPIEGKLVGTGTDVPITFEPTPGGGFEVEVPEASEFESCSHEGEWPPEEPEHEASEEELEAACEESVEEEGDAEGMVPIQVTPIETKEGATASYLVEENAVISGNTSDGVDTAVKPLTDGGMIWNDIRDNSAPEEYSWRVELGNNQELHLVDEHHAEVYYNDLTPALSITAQPGHDAVGTEVPTSLSVSKGDIVTLTVHYKAGDEGKPFVLPIIEGYDWEGGLSTTYVSFLNRPPEEGEDAEEEEGTKARVQKEAVLISRQLGGPPIFERHGDSGDEFRRRFKFMNCMHKHGAELNPGEFIEGLPPVPTPGDKRVGEVIHNYGVQCEEPSVGGGVFWSAAIYGFYHYELHHWVWIDLDQVHCNKILGEERPRVVGCMDWFTGNEHVNGSKVSGPIYLRGEYRFGRGEGHFAFDGVTCLGWIGELYPRGPRAKGEPYRSPAEPEYEFLSDLSNPCPHEEFFR